MGLFEQNDKVTLYKKDSKGKIRVWEGDIILPGIYGDTASIMIEAGLLNGKKTLTTKNITKGKNTGKKNETTPVTQARAELQAEVIKKKKEGYYSLDDLKIEWHPEKNGGGGYYKNANGEHSFNLAWMLDKLLPEEKILQGVPHPMLAHKYDETKQQGGSKDFKGWKLDPTKFYVQPKLDGIRCLAHIVKDDVGIEVELFSRKGENIFGLGHIRAELRTLFNFSTISQGQYWLDGELYTDKIPFQELNGLVRKSKNIDFTKEEVIDYHVYDTINDKPFNERIEWVESILHDNFEYNHVKFVDTALVTAVTPDKFIKDLHDEFIEAGHEGAMIRRYDGLYEQKRSANLLKVKQFEDEEFIIIGGEEAKTNNMLGAFTVVSEKTYKQCNDSRYIKEEYHPGDSQLGWKALLKDTLGDNSYFNATPKASVPEKQEMLRNLKNYIGKKATVEFFGRSVDGVPRFPRVIKIDKI